MDDDARRADETLARKNDAAALNGGPSRHWFRPGRSESLPTPRRTTKVVVAVALWGTLLAGVLILSASV